MPSIKPVPFSYSYMKAARSTGHSGGLAVIHRHDLELLPIYLPTTSFYECLAFQCKLPFPMTVLIYQPPKLIPTFITEMHDFLFFFTKLCTTSANTIILRDINIHVVTLCHSGSNFSQLLDNHNLQQQCWPLICWYLCGSLFTLQCCSTP